MLKTASQVARPCVCFFFCTCKSLDLNVHLCQVLSRCSRGAVGITALFLATATDALFTQIIVTQKRGDLIWTVYCIFILYLHVQ